MNFKTRLAKLEFRAGGNTPQRVALARICTLLDQTVDPDAPAVRPEDLPAHWRTYADLVLASYECDDGTGTASPPAGP